MRIVIKDILNGLNNYSIKISWKMLHRTLYSLAFMKNQKRRQFSNPCIQRRTWDFFLKRHVGKDSKLWWSVFWSYITKTELLGIRVVLVKKDEAFNRKNIAPTFKYGSRRITPSVSETDSLVNVNESIKKNIKFWSQNISLPKEFTFQSNKVPQNLLQLASGKNFN